LKIVGTSDNPSEYLTISSERQHKFAKAQHPDASLFAALPGSGTAYSARLLAAFGSRLELFQSAQAMLNFSGIAPVLKRSGQTTITPPPLRPTALPPPELYRIRQ
jgi:hypothetical protein